MQKVGGAGLPTPWAVLNSTVHPIAFFFSGQVKTQLGKGLLILSTIYQIEQTTVKLSPSSDGRDAIFAPN